MQTILPPSDMRLIMILLTLVSLSGAADKEETTWRQEAELQRAVDLVWQIGKKDE